ncbi:lactosylceramide 4-alpha-galactosyltransferase-like [Macrobrachium rosenbergii]|uniref:lactosylceramide 4-alpha-galactosyltransferase-like n=1 Tax=Macrobrachium rosenbergii TaxID=79674 RepID=UPI0034D43013
MRSATKILVGRLSFVSLVVILICYRGRSENDSASSHFNVPTGQLEVPSTVPSSSDEFRTPGDGGGCPLSSSAPQGRSLQLDDLFSYESEWRSAPYNIFLQESSCNPKPSYRVWCAVESLAQQNPDALVWYIMTSPVADQSDDLAPSLTQIYKNLRVAKVDLKTVFSNTPLEDIYTAGLWRKNNTWPEINLADIMRLAVVWKMGGLYADSDVVCIRQVTQLTNMIAWQEGFTLGSGVFHFSRHHPVLKLVMEYIKENFQPEKWGSSGPIVFTRILKDLCDVKDKKKRCLGVSLLPIRSFTRFLRSYGRLCSCPRTRGQLGRDTHRRT